MKKRVLSRLLLALLVKSTLPEGESNKKVACYNKMVALLSF